MNHLLPVKRQSIQREITADGNKLKLKIFSPQSNIFTIKAVFSYSEYFNSYIMEKEIFMENKLFRNAVSASIIVAMVIVSIFLPAIFNNDVVNASDAANNDAAKVTVAKGEFSSKFKLNSEDRSNDKQASSDATLSVMANPENNLINIPTTVINNKTSTFEFVGDGQYIVGTLSNIGVTCYVPYEYVISTPGYASSTGNFVGSDGYLVDPPYKLNVTPYYMGKYSVTVTFVQFQWNGTSWVDMNSDYVKTSYFNSKGYVSFNKNKGTFKTSGAAKLVTYGLTYGTLPQMKARKGYTFAGWYSAKTAGALVKSSSTVKIRNNTTLFAQWKYKITLNANKGKVSGKKTKTKSVTSGQKYGSLTTPKRSGYNFAGWYTKKSGGTWINKSKYNSNASKHTLYAHWVKKSKVATKSQYKAVRNGMTYSEVKRIFGRSGIYAVRNGYTHYIWFGKTNRSAAVVQFINGKVSQKAWV